MKKPSVIKTTLLIALLAAMAAMFTLAAHSQTTLAAWNFDNLSAGANGSPQESSGLGFGTASYLGVNVPSIVNLPGSSTGGPNSWSVTGWSTTPAIGAQGIQFAASTVGYYQIQVSFDVYASINAEAALQVQYTTEGTIWHNATITSPGTSGVIANNSIATNDLVVGSYLILTNNGTAAWDNQVTVNLSGISGLDNDANFAIRVVNASTGTNCLDTTGAVYSGGNTASWTFDNVVISGISYDTIAYWPFDNDGVLYTNTPAPAINNTASFLASANCIGFNLTEPTFTPNNSTNDADITANGAPYSSTGPTGQDVWRLRGQPGNGWYTGEPIGSQGAEFDVDTTGYTNIVVGFDLYMTTQGEAKMCVLYTTDGWVTTNVANNLGNSAFPTFIVTNTPTVSVYADGYHPTTVNGTFFWNSYGSIFFNNMVIDFTGVPGVQNNPLFGFRIVNAATGLNDCVNFLGQPYNNNSGNCRLDNVAVSGQFEGQTAPVLASQAGATVDFPFTNTFGLNPAYASAITSVFVNGSSLPNTAYTITSSNIVFYPAQSSVLQVNGIDSIVVFATGYTTAKASQYIGTGAATKFTLTQPAGPSASGGTLTVNPVLGTVDQYGLGTTNPYANMTVTASVGNSPATWTLGGSTVQPIVNGFCTFTDLTATVTGTTAVTNAFITFTVANGPITVTNSAKFTIGAPPVPFTPGNLAVLQIDTVSNNTTFSIIELPPSAAKQTTPVNIDPISATGTNALRLSSSGSCGKLTLSDDGTFLVFDAFQDGSAATPDETFNLNRAVGIVSNSLAFASPVSYTSVSYGGSQARAACSPDNQNFLIDDKDGLHVNSQLVYAQNNLSTKSFGGVAYVQTAKVANPPTASLYVYAAESPGFGVGLDWGTPTDNGPIFTIPGTPLTDPLAQDFYIITATNGGAYNILYVIDQSGGTNGSSGVLTKYFLDSNGDGGWTAAGSYTNSDNSDTLFATTNGSGSVYLYYANGSGGKSANSVVRLIDATVTGPLNITNSTTIYTAPAGTSVAGITFVPQNTPYGTELIPPPTLATTAVDYQTNGYKPFVLTLTPDDLTWRNSIIGITANGTSLPSTAYTVAAGKITFYPSNSPALEIPGNITIAISATAYSTDSIVQPIGGLPTQLVISTQPTAPAADGAVLAKQPVLIEEDANGFTVTNPVFTVTAAVGAGTWTIGGTTSVAESVSKGTVTFANLTALDTGSSAVTNATIKFTAPGLTSVTSSKFIIPAPTIGKLGNANLTGGSLFFSFTNVPGLTFSVHSTNIITAPAATWPVIGTINSSSPPGSYQFVDPNPATNGQNFYYISIP